MQKDRGMEKKFSNWMGLAGLTGDAMQSPLWIGEHERILPTYVTACLNRRLKGLLPTHTGPPW